MRKPEAHSATPHQVAEQILADAPDANWVRRLVDDLDRRVRAAPLERFMTLWELSAAEAAAVFGVSRQAFSKWLKVGPPPERAPAVAALAAATELLDHHVKRERIPAVVRRAAVQFGDRSLYELARAGEYVRVRDAVEMMFDLRRVQP